MIRVKITDSEHPHYDEQGELKSKQTVMGGRMMYVELENCPHLINGCYVEKNQITVIKEK